MWIMNVAQQIVHELGTLLPVINEATVKELLSQIRSCWITLCFLPTPIADLLRGQRFTSLEMPHWKPGSGMNCDLVRWLNHWFAQA